MNNEILSLFERVKHLIHPDDIKIILDRDGGIHRTDGLILYAHILDINPEFVIEFSPQFGYSSICIALALKRIGKKNCFATFELHKHYESGMSEEFKCAGVREYIEVIFGDALENIPKYIKNKKIEKKANFVFIDSDHSEKFAIRYIETLFPLFRDNATIIVHDIGAINNNHHGEFTETLNSQDSNSGEYKALKKYISDNKLQYVVTHALFGNKHESSKDLPVNKEMFEEVGKIIGKQIPNVGKQCSKFLIFKTKG